MIDGHVSIFIAVLNQGEVSVELVQLLNNIVASSPYPLFIDYPCEKPISYNRNKIVKHFLERPQYDYLLMIDGDIVPPPDYLKLIDFKKDIISGLCFAYTKQNIFPLILKKSKEKITGSKYRPYDSLHPDKWTGLVEVDAVGTGAMIMSRKVLEQIPYPFKNVYDKNGEKQIGLDLNFCRVAKKKGFKVFCHTDYVCSHHTRFDLKKMYYTISATFKDVNELKYKIKKLDKENETLKRSINNRKDIKKDKGKRIKVDGNPAGKKENTILNSKRKDVPEGGSDISTSSIVKENKTEGIENTDFKTEEIRRDNNTTATSETPIEPQTGDTELHTAR